jgi:predicted ATPase
MAQVPASARFAGLVREALAHLYDPVYLQVHPLAQLLAREDPRVSPAQAGRALRQRILDGIAALRPAEGAGPAAAGRRHYRLLELRYVEALDPAEVQDQLGIGKAQFYRDHARALEALLSVLAENWQLDRRDGANSAVASGSVRATGPPVLTSAPPIARRTEPHWSVPRPPTSFIGRERELAEVRLLLSQTRLLTLTGPGGSGKTRLALEAASSANELYTHGACFVDLSPLRNPALVLPAVAQALGVVASPGHTHEEVLSHFLQTKRLLLVLDNFEQVLSAGLSISRLLGSCPHLGILVTSRASLRISGEQEYAVSPMTVPDTRRRTDPTRLLRNEAVRLFVERARAVRPEFTLTDENVTSVVGICRQLDGLPLAIELTAPVIRLLSPQALHARIQQRRGALVRAPRDLSNRHQSLNAAITWSYDLLPPHAQGLFRRLAVFAGGFTLQAAATVCSPGNDSTGGGATTDHSPDLLETLLLLAEHSLVVAEGDLAGEPRFRQLQTIREYGSELLGDSDEVEAIRQRHAAYYCGLAQRAEPHLHGPSQRIWFDMLEREHDNMRAALDWVRERSAAGPGSSAAVMQGGLTLAAALGRFWYICGHLSEGRAQLSDLLSRPQPTGGELDPKYDIVREKALRAAGTLAGHADDFPAAEDLIREALAIAERLDAPDRVATSLFSLGYAASKQRNYARALALARESLDMFRALQNKGGIGTASSVLAVTHLAMGDLTEAEEMYAETLSVAREIGNHPLIGAALLGLGILALERSEYDVAHRFFQEAMASAWTNRHLWGTRIMFVCFAALAAARGQSRRALRLAAASESLGEAAALPLHPAWEDRLAPLIARAEAELGEDAAASARAEGTAMDVDEVIKYALDPGEPDTHPPSRAAQFTGK